MGVVVGTGGGVVRALVELFLGGAFGVPVSSSRTTASPAGTSEPGSEGVAATFPGAGAGVTGAGEATWGARAWRRSTCVFKASSRLASSSF